MFSEPTPNYFDPAIWAIAAALSEALAYLVLFGQPELRTRSRS
jgi:hypothetical protein